MLIAIEGIDGSGKTTVAEFLKNRLIEIGYEVILLKEPTDSPWGRKIKESYSSRLSPEEELELFLKDREYDAKENIIPALEKGMVVIMDRYYYSTIAYQGALGFDTEELRDRNEKIAPKPDLLIVLDLPPEKALKRVKKRGEPNEFEKSEYLRKVREIFLSIPEAVVVDADRETEEVKKEVLEKVIEVLERNEKHREK